MHAHRKWMHRSDFDKIDYEGSAPFYIRPIGYYGDPHVDPITEKDERDGPLAVIWFPMGAHGEMGMQVNREDAQKIVDALREAFPPTYKRTIELEVGDDWPGIR